MTDATQPDFHIERATTIRELSRLVNPPNNLLDSWSRTRGHPHPRVQITAFVMLLMLVCAPRTIAEKSSAPRGTATVESRIPITARLYGDAQSLNRDVSDDAVAAAMADTVAILNPAGVDVRVQHCEQWRSGDHNDPCGRSIGPGEFSIRTYRSSGFSPLTVGDHQLAYSLLDFTNGEGSLVTIDLSAIDWFAAASGSDRRVLLARVIAHEFGHLLLRSGDHSKSGLMRAVWSTRELRRNRAKDWAMTSRQTADIRDKRNGATRARSVPVRSAALIANLAR